MLRVAVLVSGGGTNLQAIIDAVENGTITNTQIVGVISNNKNAFALEEGRDLHSSFIIPNISLNYNISPGFSP